MSNRNDKFSEAWHNEQLHRTVEYVASSAFAETVQWDRSRGSALLTRLGSVARTEPVDCVIVGEITTDRPALKTHGNLNAKFASNLEDAKKAKYLFTLARPNEATEPLFAKDFDIAISRLLALQEHGGTSEKRDHRHFVLTDEVTGQPTKYTLRFAFPMIEEKITTTKDKDSDIFKIIEERTKISEAHTVSSDYVEIFDTLKKKHWVTPMPVFGPDSTKTLNAADYEELLIGSLVEVTFNLHQFRFGNAEYDTFTGRVKHVSILKYADVSALTRTLSPVKRKPVRKPQTPTRGEQANAAKAFVGLPKLGSSLQRQEFVEGSSKRANVPSGSDKLPGHELKDGEQNEKESDTEEGSPTKKRKVDHQGDATA